MDLIARYVHEVGSHLPRKLRQDVEAELHSLLSESLEERAREAGRPADREMVVALLREFGEPEPVAARYLPPAPALVGPHMYPIFKVVMGIVLAIIGGVFLIRMTLAAFRLPFEEWVRRLGESGAQAVDSALMNFGVVVLIFAIIERVAARMEKKKEAQQREAWDPDKLPEVKDRDRMTAGGHVFAIYAVVVFAVLFNFYPEWVGIIFRSDSEWRVVSFLRPEFAMYLPLLNLWWAAVFCLNLFVLRQGRWTTETRWAEFGIGIAGLIICAMIIWGGPVFRADRLIKAILKVALLISGIENVVRLVWLVRRHSGVPSVMGAAAGMRRS